MIDVVEDCRAAPLRCKLLAMTIGQGDPPAVGKQRAEVRGPAAGGQARHNGPAGKQRASAEENDPADSTVRRPAEWRGCYEGVRRAGGGQFSKARSFAWLPAANDGRIWGGAGRMTRGEDRGAAPPGGKLLRNDRF
jgi:hypothetical protein